MMETHAPAGHVLTVDRTIKAVPERVFAAWTEPAQLMAWYAPDDSWTTPSAEVDLRVGGTYRIGLQRPGAEPFFESGEFVEVDPPHRLVYTQRTDGPSRGAGEHILVTVEFTPSPDGTLVRVLEQGYADPAVRDLHASGWPRFLDRLATLVTP